MEVLETFQYDKLLLQFLIDSTDGRKDRGLNSGPNSLSPLLCCFFLAPSLAFAASLPFFLECECRATLRVDCLLCDRTGRINYFEKWAAQQNNFFFCFSLQIWMQISMRDARISSAISVSHWLVPFLFGPPHFAQRTLAEIRTVSP